MSSCVQCDGAGSYSVFGLKLSCVCEGSAPSEGTKSSKSFPPNEEARKRMHRKAKKCLAIVTARLGEGASDSQIENKAVALMDLDEEELDRLCSGDLDEIF